jgi:hypothetical protein
MNSSLDCVTVYQHNDQPESAVYRKHDVLPRVLWGYKNIEEHLNQDMIYIYKTCSLSSLSTQVMPANLYMKYLVLQLKSFDFIL